MSAVIHVTANSGHVMCFRLNVRLCTMSDRKWCMRKNENVMNNEINNVAETYNIYFIIITSQH